MNQCELTPDMVKENKSMKEIKKFRNIVRECISEIKKENDPRIKLKESLRGMVKNVLNEFSNSGNLKRRRMRRKSQIRDFSKMVIQDWIKPMINNKKNWRLLFIAIDPAWMYIGMTTIN